MVPPELRRTHGESSSPPPDKNRVAEPPGVATASDESSGG